MQLNWGGQVMHLFRVIVDTILHTSSFVKNIIMLSLVLSCSSVCSLELLQSRYFEDKNNFLNRNFAKLGWGWTLCCVIPVSLLTSLLYSGFNFTMTLRHLSRVGVAHCMFLGITSLIVTNKALSVGLGYCSSIRYRNQADCNTNGEKWTELDISGHTFLLAYCIFVLTEECKAIRQWPSYQNILAKGNDFEINRLQASSSKESLISVVRNTGHLVKLHSFASPAIKLLEVMACIEIILMGNMFIATQLYHHAFTEKLLGYFLAVVCCSMTYGVWYGRCQYGPCTVRDGVLNPARVST